MPVQFLPFFFLFLFLLGTTSEVAVAMSGKLCIMPSARVLLCGLLCGSNCRRGQLMKISSAQANDTRSEPFTSWSPWILAQLFLPAGCASLMNSRYQASGYRWFQEDGTTKIDRPPAIVQQLQSGKVWLLN